MDRQAAIRIVRDTFEAPFDKARYVNFCRNLLNYIDTSRNFSYQGNYVPDAYKSCIRSLERIGQYQDSENKTIEVLIIHLKKETSLERARTMQRNFIAWYLDGSRGGELKDAALVAVISPDSEDWRFSLVKMEYNLELSEKTGRLKTEKLLTPARRYSFLVGRHESSHTAQGQLLPILQDDVNNPTLARLEQAFSIEVVTREFFEKYRELFHKAEEALQKIIGQDGKIKADFEAKGVSTADFSKKLLGQIVFLYFLQKKGWFGVERDGEWGSGPKDFLRRLFNKKAIDYSNFFNDMLEPLFYEALAAERTEDFYSRFNCKIPFLNGGLFDPIKGYDWVHTDILLPNALFSNSEKTKEGDNGTGILDVFDRYNFTVKEDEPLDREVAVDPEMLGKVFENLLEVKDRKSKGTYYTPREIVHYMCQESLINYLDTAINTGDVPLAKIPPPQGKLFGKPDPKQKAMTIKGNFKRVPKEDIEIFIRSGHLTAENDMRVENSGKETERYSYRLPSSVRQHAELVDQKLSEVRICDPAVGSGAFPVGLMTEIVRARNTLTTYVTKKEGRSYYNFKRHAIQSCLYGVDIDPGAVEIAKLRLWLSLVVDEEDIKQIQPLPNLDYKIVCGNSLLGVERNMFNNELFQNLEELKPVHFDETNARKKQQYKGQIDRLIGELTDNKAIFDFEVYFSEVFHEKGGFDIVIANPPYIRQEQLKELKPELQKSYKCYAGTADIFVYFYERGYQTLRENGILTFISSNKYFRAGYGARLRAFMGSNCQICRIIDFGDAPVFDAIAYPSIIVLRKILPQSNTISIFNWQPGPPLTEFASVVQTRSASILQKELSADGWQLESPEVIRLLEKLRKAGTPLNEYVGGRFYRGILTGLNEAFVIDRITRDRLISDDQSSREILKPFLRGRDVKRWQIENQDLWLIFTRRGIEINKYPAIKNYLYQYKKQLMPGVKDGRKPGSYKWYEIQDNIAYWREFEQPKIVYPNICKRNEFAWDEDGYYFNQKTFIIPDATKYLLGILNSSVIGWLFNKLLAKLQNGYFEPSALFMKDFPIPVTTDIHEIETLVNEILLGQALNNNTDVSDLEHRIDQIVYQLYGLTPEEISLIEGQQ